MLKKLRKKNLLPSAEITFPNTNSPWFILTPSLNLVPVAFVFLDRSDPAKSTKWNLDVVKVFLYKRNACLIMDN